jgi:hypothetical protein
MVAIGSGSLDTNPTHEGDVGEPTLTQNCSAIQVWQCEMTALLVLPCLPMLAACPHLAHMPELQVQGLCLLGTCQHPLVKHLSACAMQRFRRHGSNLVVEQHHILHCESEVMRKEIIPVLCHCRWQILCFVSVTGSTCQPGCFNLPGALLTRSMRWLHSSTQACTGGAMHISSVMDHMQWQGGISW